MNTHPATAPARGLWWPPLFIFGAACAFCWPVFAGRIMLPADMCLLMLPWKALQSQFPDFHRAHNPMLDPIQQYLPWRIYAVESVRNGLIPLWNPYAFCGTPFLANLQSALLYPLNLLFLITGARHGFGLSAVLHLILGGLFMYAFLRTLALSQPAALLGALVLVFNGWTVAWLEYPTLSLWVFMWLPALLLCYQRALRQPRSLWPILCPLVVGVQFLGGHLQLSAYLVIAFMLYALVRIISREDRAASRPLALAIALGSLAIGLALAAGQLLPTIELAEQSGRVAHGASAALETAFPLSHFILYLVPNFFGNPVDYNYWGNVRDQSAFNFFETACYVGILPLFLAVVSFTAKRTWRLWFFAGLTVFGILAAIGSPLYLLLHYLTPGFRELAGLGRVLCLAAFGLAGLAALGLDALLEDSARNRTGLCVSCAAAACFCIALARFAFQPYVKLLDPAWRFDSYLKHELAIAFALIVLSALLIGLRLRARLGPSLAGAIACALVLADLFVSGLSFNPFTDSRMAYPETEATRWLEQHAGHDRIASLALEDRLDWMPHNSPMVFGLRDIHGSDSLRVKRSFELVSGPELAQATYPPSDSPLLDALGVKYLMTKQQVGAGWKLALAGDAPIYENTNALPRARLVAAAPVGAHSRAPNPLASCPVRWSRDAAHLVRLETDCPLPALLVLTDSYYPGWTATVDAEPVGIQLAERAFRAVAVPAGKHVVEFRYQPATFRIGLFVSLIACAALAAAATQAYLSRK